MQLRVATWNLNRRGSATWTRLAALANVADVVLVQEARPPIVSGQEPYASLACWPELRDPDGWAPVPSGAARTGVVLLHSDLELRPIERDHVEFADESSRSHPGTLTICDVHLAGDYLLTVGSAYGMFEQKDVSELSMGRIANEVELLLRRRPRLVLGGDFNMWIQPWKDGQPYGPYREVFSRLESMGMFDCLFGDGGATRGPLDHCPCGGGDSCRHVRTLRHMNARESVPWQVDYVFASSSLRPMWRDSSTIDDDSIWATSDHCVVVATFELPAVTLAADN